MATSMTSRHALLGDVDSDGDVDDHGGTEAGTTDAGEDTRCHDNNASKTFVVDITGAESDHFHVITTTCL